MRWQKTSGLANQKSPTLTTPKCIKYQKISYISLFCIRMRTNSSTFERTHSMPKLPVSTCMMLRPRKATLQQFHCNLQVHSSQIQSWNMLPLIISCHCRMSVIYFAAYPSHKEIRAWRVFMSRGYCQNQSIQTPLRKQCLTCVIVGMQPLSNCIHFSKKDITRD